MEWFVGDSVNIEKIGGFVCIWIFNFKKLIVKNNRKIKVFDSYLF